MKSYINAFKYGNQIIHSYIEDGERKREVVQFQPILGYIVPRKTDWSDIYGNYLETRRFDSMSECYEWKKSNENLFDVYGSIDFVSQFIAQTYQTEVFPQKHAMKIFNIDIECWSSEGFPKASNPENFINAITFQDMVKNKYYIYSLKDYTPKSDNVQYFKCKSEEDLLEHILDFIARMDVDILTGWNISVFDIPFIIDRITLLLGEDKAKRLSPINKIRKSEKIINKHTATTYSIDGLIIADYIELYRKFVFDNRESYSLNYISRYELGKEKLKYQEEFGDLNSLYEKDFEKFIDYNLLDVELVYLIDQKLKFLDISIGYAYSMKCNIENIFGTLKPWDNLIYSELYNKNILCNPSKKSIAQEFMGGYVRDPIRGLHTWVFIDDIVSSYPNNIIQYNLSNETVVSDSEIRRNEELLYIRNNFTGIDKCIDNDTLKEIQPILKKNNLTFTSNGQFFRLDKQGFIPEIVERIFNERVAVKGKIKEAKQKKDKQQIEYLENLSLILKIKINSLYGALSTPYFRWFDIRLSTAVTYQGQVSVKGAGAYLIKKCPDIKWVYADTDSLQCSLEEIVNKRYKDDIPDNQTVAKFLMKYHSTVIEPHLTDFFKELSFNLNVFKPAINMEFECLADVAIYLEKKKYALQIVNKEGDWCLDKPKMKIKGIEVVRSSTPQCVRDKLKEAVELIFKTKDNSVLLKFMDKFKKDFFKMKFEDIAFPRGVNFSDYNLQSKSLPIAVRGAFVYNKALVDLKLSDKYVSIGDGSKTKFCYIKAPNIFESDVISCIDKLPEEILKNIKIDHNLQWEKTFINPLDKIFSSIGWTTKNIVDLGSFFD